MNDSLLSNRARQLRPARFLAWVMVGVLGLVVVAYLGMGAVYANRVFPGIRFLEINLGGQTVERAAETIRNRIGNAELGTLRLEFEGQLWEVDPNQFGFELDADKLANEAVRVGRRGNLWQRLEERSAVLTGAHQPIISETDLVHTFDRVKLANYLTELATSVDQPRRDAKLTIRNNRATEFITHQDGRALDIDKTIAAIAQNLLNPASITLPVELQPATVTLAQTNTLGIDALIAQGVSDFAGSPRNRRHNIATGAAKFDGVLIAPNTTFSFLKVLGEVDASTGYLPELVIKGDQTTPEFGGGLCQVSTTAFRAILNGGLPVVERRNHSYRVAYYEPAGTDATIYQPYPDLKFKNDTPGHILMDTYIEGNKLYFDFYGTDLDREVELTGPFISNVTDYPEPIYIDTSTIPVGTTKQVEVAHRGADAVLYRKVYQDGKMIFNDTFKSHYIPWPAKYLRGVEEAAPVEANLDNAILNGSTNESTGNNPNPTI